MDLVIFEQNKPLVLKALRSGEFDYIEAASEVFEPTSSASSRPGQFSIDFQRPTPLHAREKMCPCGFMWQATFP